MSYTKRLLIAAMLALGLSACGQTVKPPKVVYVEVSVPAKIPEELLKDCPIAEPENPSVKELLNVTGARKLSLQQCNKDKEALRKL